MNYTIHKWGHNHQNPARLAAVKDLFNIPDDLKQIPNLSKLCVHKPCLKNIEMKKILGLIYYQVFRLLYIVNDEREDSAAASAWLFCSIVSSFFFIDILLVIFGSNRILVANQGIWYLFVFAINTIFYYFLTYYRKKYLKLIEPFKNEKKTTSVLGGIVLVSFSIAVTVLFFVL